MWSVAQRQRLAFERALLGRYMPQFRFCNPVACTYVAGPVYTNAHARYDVRLELPQEYPYAMPRLLVTYPRILWQHGKRGIVNTVGTSHAFHTRANSSGYVEICHFRDWYASLTCLAVLIKAHLWCEAYQAHLRTGRELAEFLRTSQ
jgi:hypothetical protein